MVTTAVANTAMLFFYFHHCGILKFLPSAHVARRKKSISEVAVVTGWLPFSSSNKIKTMRAYVLNVFWIM